MDDIPKKKLVYSLSKALAVCEMDSSTYYARLRGEHSDFWLADNHTNAQYTPGKRGKKCRPNPRFHSEHIEYMAAVVTGILSEKEAADLWPLRRKAIRDALHSRALAPETPAKKKSQKKEAA